MKCCVTRSLRGIGFQIEKPRELFKTVAVAKVILTLNEGEFCSRKGEENLNFF